MDTRDYELMYIVSPTVADDQLPGANERVGAIIGNLGGEVADTNVWGKRRLAYPIGKHDDGYYVVAKIKLQPSRARDLEAQLRISDEVIRHILIQPEEPKQRSAPKERPVE
ncbi:MAG TPA: 30S ribosomal protein S6, partial [Chloroflexia bacterium]|nr:30S ribosomal protein S6 [Chloroflexia bacterium]